MREYLNYKEIEKKSTDKLNEDDQNGLQFLPRTRKTEARKTKTQRSKSNECDLPPFSARWIRRKGGQ